MQDRSQISSAENRYKFTGKERDSEAKYDYFGARYYNSKLGLWLQVDPLAEKYPGWSPYNYTLNNPIKYIDPDGEYVKRFIDNQYIFTRVDYWGGGILKSIENVPFASWLSLVLQSAKDDPSLGMPSVGDYVFNGIGGRVLGENAAFALGVSNTILSLNDIATALWIDQDIFRGLVNQKDDGISMVTYGASKEQLVLNDEWVKVNFAGNVHLASTIINDMIITEWKKRNPKLYRKLYESNQQNKPQSNEFFNPVNTRNQGTYRAVNFDASSQNGE